MRACDHIVVRPKGGVATQPSLQDDLALRFDSDAKRAADTLDRLRTFSEGLASSKDVTGVRGNVVYDWTINEYHHPSAPMHRLFDRCLPR
ncbi:MAG: hypothetical protein ACJ734_10945 [Gaiellaceae bacterium]